jgi:hypothetical protein
MIIIKRNGRNKYGNRMTEINGIKFASKKEACRYEELLWLEKAEKIENLELQKSFELQEAFVNKRGGQTIRPISYVCDFFYYDKENECYTVEDVKGLQTEVYKIKKKLFLKKYGDTYNFREL